MFIYLSLRTLQRNERWHTTQVCHFICIRVSCNGIWFHSLPKWKFTEAKISIFVAYANEIVPSE